MQIINEQQKRINKLGKKYDLKLIVVYGSYARDEQKKTSDLDIAVLGNKEISFKKLLDISSDFNDIFRIKELDVKSLHNTDPFYKYMVMKDAKLIYGDLFDFHNFKAS